MQLANQPRDTDQNLSPELYAALVDSMCQNFWPMLIGSICTAAAALMTALEDVCRDGPKTRDVGGTATTREVGDAIAERVA